MRVTFSAPKNAICWERPSSRMVKSEAVSPCTSWPRLSATRTAIDCRSVFDTKTVGRVCARESDTHNRRQRTPRAEVDVVTMRLVRKCPTPSVASPGSWSYQSRRGGSFAAPTRILPSGSSSGLSQRLPGSVFCVRLTGQEPFRRKPNPSETFDSISNDPRFS